MVAKKVSVNVKKQQYHQIWLLPEFLTMSEKYIVYRPLKRLKRLKYSLGLKINILLTQEC